MRSTNEYIAVGYLDNLESKLESYSVILGLINSKVHTSNESKGLRFSDVFNDSSTISEAQALLSYYGFAVNVADESNYIPVELLGKLSDKASEIEIQTSQVKALKDYLLDNTTKSAVSASAVKGVEAVISAISAVNNYNLNSLKVSEARDAQVAVRDASNINAALTEIVATNKNVYKDFIDKKILLPVTDAHLLRVNETGNFREFDATDLVKSIYLDIRQKINLEMGPINSKLEASLQKWLDDTEKRFGNNAFEDFNQKSFAQINQKGPVTSSEKEQITLGNQTAWFHKIFNSGLNEVDSVINNDFIYSDVLSNELRYANAYKFSSTIAKSLTTIATFPNSIFAAISDDSPSNIISATKFASDALGFTLSQATELYLSKDQNGAYFANLKERAVDFKTKLDTGVLDVTNPIKSALKNEQIVNINLATELSSKLRTFSYEGLATKEAWSLGSSKELMRGFVKNPFSFSSDILAASKDIYSLTKGGDQYSNVVTSLGVVADVAFFAGDALALAQGARGLEFAAKSLNAVGSVILAGLSIADLAKVAMKYDGDYSTRQSKFDLAGAVVNTTASVAAIAATAVFPPAALAVLVIPDFHSIGVALDLQDQIQEQKSLGNLATAQVLQIAHTNAALDATPIVDWFSSIYRSSLAAQIDQIQSSESWQASHMGEIVRSIDKALKTSLNDIGAKTGSDLVEFISISNNAYFNMLDVDSPETKFADFYVTNYSSLNAASYDKDFEVRPGYWEVNLNKDVTGAGNTLTIVDLPSVETLHNKKGGVEHALLNLFVTNETESSNNNILLKANDNAGVNGSALFDIDIVYAGAKNSSATFKVDSNYLQNLDKLHVKQAGYAQHGFLMSLDLSTADLKEVDFSKNYELSLGYEGLQGFDIIKGPVLEGTNWANQLSVSLHDFNNTYLSSGYSKLNLGSGSSTVYSYKGDEINFEGGANLVYLKAMPTKISGASDFDGASVSSILLEKGIAFEKGVLSYIGHADYATASGFSNFIGTQFNDSISITGDQGIQYLSTGGGFDSVRLKDFTGDNKITVFSSDGFDASLDNVSNATIYMGGGDHQVSKLSIGAYSPFANIIASSSHSLIKNFSPAESYYQKIGFQGDNNKSLEYYSGLGGAKFYVEDKVNISYMDNAHRSSDVTFIVDDLSSYTLSSLIIDPNSSGSNVFKKADFLEYLGGSGESTDQLVLNYTLSDIKHSSVIDIYTNSITDAPLVFADVQGHAVQIGMSSTGVEYFMS